MKPFCLLPVLCLLAACGGSEASKPTAPAAIKTASRNSEAFNQAFGKLMSDYYGLRDAFITENDTSIVLAAKRLAADADSLHTEQASADREHLDTAATYAQGISAEIKGLLGEQTLEEKRKAFYMTGEQVYGLVQAVHYDRQVVYRDHCPMAFNDEGANWLSNTPEIRNPYFPKKMPDCGEIKDSIDFTNK